MKQPVQATGNVTLGALCAAALIGLLPAVTASAQDAEIEYSDADDLTVGTDDAFGYDQAPALRGGVKVSARSGPMGQDTYIVQEGDTLFSITERFYGDPMEWPKVWSFNQHVTNPHWIYPSTVIRLRDDAPAVENVAQPAASGTRASGPKKPLFSRVTNVDRLVLREQGYIDRDALKSAGEIAASFEDHMMMSPQEQVYVRFDKERGQAPSGELTIFRVADKPDDRAHHDSGVLVQIYGTVRIDSYDRQRKLARATIVEALDPIERGLKVAEVPRNFWLVPPKRNARQLVTKVVASLRPRQLLASQQLIFVAVGRDKGVEAGNRLFVTREGDSWRRELPKQAAEMGAAVELPKEPSGYPHEVIAEGRVVSVRPKSAAVWLTRAIRAAQVGDRVEMRMGY